ncbi:MAG: hypothetical protein JO227_05545 [Acetobacteraceae bacterium]|nr:hypothetical protein [Acetobacteraceae bacterium]
MSLPPILPPDQILERLKIIFPEGTPDRNYLIREMAARAVFTALYIGTVDGSRRWLAPRHVLVILRLVPERARKANPTT